MNDQEVSSLGRIMAGLLRHFPDKVGLMMDGHGWIEISSMVNSLRTSRSGFHWLREKHIEAMAETDPKGRYQVDGGMIRATYGHTVDVNLDDLPEGEKDTYYYPVTEEEADIVLEGGLHPTDRSMVHLSGSIKKAVEAGKVRTDEPIILQINGKKARKDEIKIRKAGRDVYVVHEIDPKYISKVEENKVKKATTE